MDDLVDKLDDNATKNFQIVSTNHSKMAEYRKQLKIKAIQAAKEKGIYLTEALGEKLGETVTITEPEEVQPYIYNNYYYNRAMSYSNNYYAQDTVGAPPTPPVDFRKIKLRYELNVVFALK